MKRSYLIITIVALVLVGSLVGFIIVSVSTFANVTRTYNFAYNPGSPAPIEGLDLYTDIGYVNIKYNTSAMSEYITVDVTVSMSGGFMAGKEPEDFFNSPTDWWDTSSSPAVFNMYLNPIAWWDPVNWFKSILVAINVTLRTDVVYDLKAMTATGSMDALFPDNVVLNDTILTTTTGRMGVKTEANSVVNGRFHLSATTGNINLDADDA